MAVTATTDTSITIAWSPNNSYLVTNVSDTLRGSYNVYYGEAPGDYDPSPIQVQGTSHTLYFLDPPLEALAAPVLEEPVPRDGKLLLSWSTVTTATGYKVHYGRNLAGENEIDVQNTTSYTLTGLTNGIPYYVAISSYAQREIFIAVTAEDSMLNESDYSKETSGRIGPVVESIFSDQITEFPEALTAYPLLPNSQQGCFIATAAYGSSSAAEVKVLRAFRDRYLLTTSAGRAFVLWYYRNGAAAAALLNAHPVYKPAVRALLMPVVGAAIFMTRTALSVKAATLLIFGAALILWKTRGQFSRKAPAMQRKVSNRHED